VGQGDFWDCAVLGVCTACGSRGFGMGCDWARLICTVGGGTRGLCPGGGFSMDAGLLTACCTLLQRWVWAGLGGWDLCVFWGVCAEATSAPCASGARGFGIYRAPGAGSLPWVGRVGGVGGMGALLGDSVWGRGMAYCGQGPLPTNVGDGWWEGSWASL